MLNENLVRNPERRSEHYTARTNRTIHPIQKKTDTAIRSRITSTLSGDLRRNITFADFHAFLKFLRPYLATWEEKLLSQTSMHFWNFFLRRLTTFSFELKALVHHFRQKSAVSLTQRIIDNCASVRQKCPLLINAKRRELDKQNRSAFWERQLRLYPWKEWRQQGEQPFIPRS